MLFKTRKTVPPKMGKQPEIVKTDLKGFVAKKFHGPRTYITYTISPNKIAVSLQFLSHLTRCTKNSHRRCPTTIYQPGFWGFRLGGGFTSCYGGPATAGWYGRSDGSEVHAVAHVRFDLCDLHPLESLDVAFGWMIRWNTTLGPRW